MKRNVKHKTLITGLAALSCVGILLAGCGADDSEPESSNKGQVITKADLQTSDPAPRQDAAEAPADDPVTKKPAETVSPADETEIPVETASLYEQFLYNDLAASIGDSYPQEDYRTPILEAGTSYTLSEIGSRVSEYFLNPEYTDKTSYDYMQYAYVDCPDNPDSDQKSLLIKFVGLNIYSQDDDSYAVFVLSENNGGLFITHEYECWARSAATAYKNGILSDSGSAGAGDHYAGLSAILSDGIFTSIYSLEVMSGWWTSSVSETAYKEVFGENTETNLIVNIYSIGSDRYYLYDFSYCTEEEIAMCETYIDRCQSESGINWVTEEEIQTIIRNRCSALGIDYSLIESHEEAVWNNL